MSRTVVYPEQDSEFIHDRLEFGDDRAANQGSVLIGGSAYGDVSQQDITKREDRNRWKKLKDLSKHHINKIVDDQMALGNIDADKWGNFLHKCVIQAVDSVKPSSRYLRGDSMDFNSYVDIQLVDYKDESKCQLINGCVFMKNLSDKRMPHSF